MWHADGAVLLWAQMEETASIAAAAMAADAPDVVGAAGGAPGAEVVERGVRTTPRELTLARFVYETFLENERFAVEKGFHETMRESWRVCRSEYSEDEKRKLAAVGVPADMFEPITEVRRCAALSQLKEIFASSGQFPAKLSPTSHPDVPGYVTARALQRIVDEFSAFMQKAGPEVSQEAAARFGFDRMDELLRAEREDASVEIQRLERFVRDDFEEGDFMDAFARGVEYLTLYGTALWEGPVPCIRWKNEYSDAEGRRIRRVAKPSVAFRAVNPLDVYPAPDQVNCEDGPLCIRVRIPSSELWLNAKDAKGRSDAEAGVWFSDTIEDLLAKYPDGGVRLSWRDGEEKNREMRGGSSWTADASCMMEGISYYGQVRGHLLTRMGVAKSHDGRKISDGEYYEVNALVVDDYCVYCRIINPCLGRPVTKATFYSAADSFFGGSIAQRLAGHQRVLNGCLTALAVNMNMTAAPIAWVSDVSRLLDKSPNALKLSAGKVFAFRNPTSGVLQSSGLPMGALRVDSRVNEILAVMNMSVKRADDVSGIPSYTYGQNVTGGAGRTYSGLAMLTEAANRVMKMVIDGLDRNVIRRIVKMDAYRLMLYDSRVGYTGDVEVNPTGAMGLILKQQEMQKVLQLMQMVAGNQMLVQLVGARGLMELFRQVLETYDIRNVDRIIPSKEDLDLREFVQMAQQAANVQQGVAAMQQMGGGQGGGQGGALAPVRQPSAQVEEGAAAEGQPAPGSADERRAAG